MSTDIGVVDVADGGPALFRVVRFWGRRWAGESVAGRAEGPGHVGHVQVLEALDAASGTGPATIAAIAVELGLDRSNASRMISAAERAGYLQRSPAPLDARRVELGTTPAGRELLAAAREWQRRAFAELVAGWRPGDARRFAGYLTRLATQLPRAEERGEPA